MARVLIATPLLEDALKALAEHELIPGEPGSDPQAQALICPPTVRVSDQEIAAMPELRVIAVAGAGTDAVDLAAAAA